MAITYGTIKLDGVAYKLVAGSEPSEIANDRFAPKITTGDYSLDSNDLLSADVMGNFSGGHGVGDRREGVHDDRYLSGTIYTRHPNKLSKPFRITRILLGGGAGNVFPLGDMYDTGAWHKYFDLNGTLYKDDVSVGSISFVPVNRSVVFQGAAATPYLFIPQGSNGYATYEPVGNTRTQNGGEDMVAFLPWNKLLVGIDDDGQLYYTTTAGTTPTWTSYGTDGKLDASCRPKNLLGYWNRAGERSIYIVTDNGLFVFDPAQPILYEIPDITSVNPKFGEGSCVFNGNLYVSAGMDIIEFNGNVGRNIGLSRDDGLAGGTNIGTTPYVFDLCATQNSMYAMVNGTSGGNSIASIHEFSGANNSWHMIEARTHSLPGIGIAPTKVGGGYKLTWGGQAGAYSTQALPVDYTNPAAVASSSFGYAAGGGVSAFTSSYVMYSAYFDGGMPGYIKIASSMQVEWTSDSDADFLVEYRCDSDTDWTELLTLDNATHASGTYYKWFGTTDANGAHPGIPFRKIQFRFTITEGSNNPSTSPIIKQMVLAYLKKMNPSWSWTCQLDLSEPFENRSPDQMYDALVALKDATRFYAIELQSGDVFTGQIAQMSDSMKTNTDLRRTVTLSLVEIRPQFGAPISDEAL